MIAKPQTDPFTNQKTETGTRMLCVWRNMQKKIPIRRSDQLTTSLHMPWKKTSIFFTPRHAATLHLSGLNNTPSLFCSGISRFLSEKNLSLGAGPQQSLNIWLTGISVFLLIAGKSNQEILSRSPSRSWIADYFFVRISGIHLILYSCTPINTVCWKVPLSSRWTRRRHAFLIIVERKGF